MTDVNKYFALNLQGFDSCTEVRGSNVMQKYYFIFLLPNFSSTFFNFSLKICGFREQISPFFWNNFFVWFFIC